VLLLHSESIKRSHWWDYKWSQIYCWVCRRENFENWSIFGKGRVSLFTDAQHV